MALPHYLRLLIAFTVLAFFLGMYDTHRLLSATQSHELARAQERLCSAYRNLQDTQGQFEEAQATALVFSRWSAAYAELKSTRSWPYNTAMLRTLVVSGLVPFAAVFIRISAMWFVNLGITHA